MNYTIRKIKEIEYKLLDDFVYEAIFIPEGTAPPPKSIINQPELQVYIKNFGKEKDDICFVAEAEGKIVGAVWVRDMADYGHIAEGVPSFAISLFKEYRNFGIGTALMKTMLAELKSRGYERTSLAVQKANYAVKMYRNVGFYIIDKNAEEFIMVCDLNTEIVPYENKYYTQLIEFLEKCLPQSGRALDIDGRHSFYKDIQHNFKGFYCMLHGEKIIGAVAVHHLSEKDCELKSLYLLQEYHGRGYGRKLLNTAVSLAKKLGYAKMYLDSLSTSTRAIALYKKSGFVDTEKYNDSIRSDVFMVLELNNSQ